MRNSGVCFNLSLNGCGQASCFSSISALHGLLGWIYTGQWRSLSCHMQHYLNLFHVPSGGFVGAPEGEMT